MIVSRAFRFYAAHRNYLIADKCANLHGHRYGLEVEVQPPSLDGAGVSVLFGDLEAMLAPVVAQYDHSLIISSDDPAKDALLDSQACGKTIIIDTPSSAEHLCLRLLKECVEVCEHVVAVTLRETDSCTVRMDKDDLRRFA